MDVTPYGGIGVMHRLVTKLGLPKDVFRNTGNLFLWSAHAS